jgi:starch synthase
MKALVVHPGTQHAFHLAGQLQRHGCLSRFWTGFAYVPDTMLGRWVGNLPLALERRIAGRRLNGVPAEKLCTQPRVDLRALRQLRAGHDEQTVMFERNATFQRRIPTKELTDSDFVIGVDTASWLLAERASSLGRCYILDRTIGHPLAYEQLFPMLQKKFPEWMEERPHRLASLQSSEDAEHRLASLIVVGSSFTRRTLVESGVPAEKIIVIPLGVDLEAFTPVARPDSSRPLRFLYLGLLGARKGLPLLLEAWHSLGQNDAELLIAGSISDRVARLIPPMPGLRVLGRVSRRELPGLLQQCDVLVFPSYFEGFGAVLLESMAAGLAIIATEATGAPDLITQGVEGFVIPTGDAEALQDAMRRFLTSPGDLVTMSLAARRCAERYSWDAYGDRWTMLLRQACDTCSPHGTSDAIPHAVLASTGPRRAARTNGPKALLVHPGTQYSFQLAGQLQRHGCLSRFWTGLAYVPGSPLGHYVECLPMRVQRQLANRSLDGVPVEKLRTRPLSELRALRQLRAGHDDQSVMYKRNAAFQRQIPQQELADSNVVIGFDTSSWILIERASELGLPFLLDQSIGHPLSYRAIFPMLRQKFPGWAEDFPPRFPEQLKAEKAEHRLASRIVAASSFTRRTLIEQGVPAEKIVVNSYGVDLDKFSAGLRGDSSRPVRFVFLGSLGARKGVPLLLESWRSLAPTAAELWLVGPVSEGNARLIPALPGLRLIGKVPHRELPELFRQCDVLVLPSYFEGFGLVLLEAMAAGLPIIATDATAAPDLITQGIEGYVIPVGDGEALRDAMQRFIKSPGDLARMSPAARLAAERFSWDAYGDRWLDILRQVV